MGLERRRGKERRDEATKKVEKQRARMRGAEQVEERRSEGLNERDGERSGHEREEKRERGVMTRDESRFALAAAPSPSARGGLLRTQRA